MDFVGQKKTCVEAHEQTLRVLLHCGIFLMLTQAYGSSCLPLFDYPLWHDRFELVAFGNGLSGWAQINRIFGAEGRFTPLYFLVQGLTLHLNYMPQLSYWILAVTCFQLSSYLLYNLVKSTTKSSGLALAGCVFFVLNPYTIATYWTAMNTETLQMPFVLAFLIFSYRYLCEKSSKTNYLCTLLFWALALFSKESSVFLLPALFLQTLFAILMKISSKKNHVALVSGSLAVTVFWWVVRSAFVSSSALGVLGGNLVTFLPSAVFKRLSIITLETLITVPGLCVALIFIALQVLSLFHAGRSKQTAFPAYPTLFLLLPLVTWMVGLSLFSRTEVRYLVPLVALGAAVSMQPLQSVGASLRKVFWVVAVLMLINSAAAAWTAREVQTAWTRLEGDMVRSISELPEKSVIFCGATYRASEIRIAHRVTWSLDRFFGHRSISVLPLSKLDKPTPHSYLLIADERFVSEWTECGWHPDEHSSGIIPTADLLASWNNNKTIGLEVHGWQIRGWHLLVLAKKLMNGTSRDLVPLGPTTYEASFRIYDYPSYLPLPRAKLPASPNARFPHNEGRK